VTFRSWRGTKGGLGLLLILTAVGSLGAGTAEDPALRFIKMRDGQFKRDDKAPGKPVVWVDLGGAQMGNLQLKELAPLQNLRYLNLSGTFVSGAGLKRLAPFKQLQTLRLDPGTQVSDEALQSLREIGQFHALYLASAEDDKRAASPEAVVVLDLSDTRVSDAGLKELAPLKNLQILDLSGTRVTDAGLKELALLKNLQALDLAGTKVSDEGIKELKKSLPKCTILR
jgi:Leucine-rich repeat (LRR) protein